MELKSDNAKDLWISALSNIFKEGDDYTDNEGRVCREIINLSLTLTGDFSSSLEKPIDTMLRANNWVYPSKEELANIMFKGAQAPIYEYTYGGRIFNFGNEFNQLDDFIIPLLNHDSNSRRAIISVYNPLTDSNVLNRNSPGIIYIYFRIKEEKLLMFVAIRSNDMFFGWPANLYQLNRFQEHVMKELNLKRGDLTIFSNSAHFFLDDSHDILNLIDVDFSK